MFNFAWPYILLLCPLILIVQIFFPRYKKMQEAMLRVPLLGRIEHLTKTGTSTKHSLDKHQIYGVLVWIFLVVACANPEWLGEPVSLHQEGRNIMLAVDLSPSMSIPDFKRGNQLINRLQSVKSIAADFIEARRGDKMGLILFGSKAYLQTPLTFDRQTVKNMLDDASIGLAGDRTAIGDALGQAIKKLSHEDERSRVVILLTDGGNNAGVVEPIEAASLAQKHKIKIYTIGIGATELVINTAFGPQVVNTSADLDEALLKDIASKTGGQYFRANDQKALANILDLINQVEPVQAENKTARPITALFYWPLAVACVFLSLLLLPEFKMKLGRS